MDTSNLFICQNKFFFYFCEALFYDKMLVKKHLFQTYNQVLFLDIIHIYLLIQMGFMAFTECISILSSNVRVLVMDLPLIFVFWWRCVGIRL